MKLLFSFRLFFLFLKIYNFFYKVIIFYREELKKNCEIFFENFYIEKRGKKISKQRKKYYSDNKRERGDDIKICFSQV